MTTHTDTTERPAATWATWALLKAAAGFSPDTLEAYITNRLRQLVGDPEAGPRAFVVLTGCGHWGRGATLTEAAAKAYKAGAGKREWARAVLVLNDDTPEVNQGGRIISNSDSAQLNLGAVGTVGALMKGGAACSV